MRTEHFKDEIRDAVVTTITEGVNALRDSLTYIDIMTCPGHTREFVEGWIARRKLIVAAARYGDGL